MSDILRARGALGASSFLPAQAGNETSKRSLWRKDGQISEITTNFKGWFCWGTAAGILSGVEIVNRARKVWGIMGRD